MIDGGGEVGEGVEVLFDVAGEFVEAAEAVELLGVAEFGGVKGAPEDREGFVVGLEENGEGVSVFAAMSEGETGGIGEAAGCAVNDFGHERQRLKGARAQTFDQ